MAEPTSDNTTSNPKQSTMRDQADPLRNLVLRQSAAGVDGTQSRMIVIAGGKSGLGVTTLTVNLAVALARHGLRTVLIDADMQHADAALLCGCATSPNLGEVLASRRDIHEVLQRGPGGIQLVPGVAFENSSAACTPKAQQRFLRQLHSLSKHVDVVVVDAGSAPTELARQLWACSDEILLVTSPDVVAVMDSYSAVKTMFAPAATSSRLQLVVNQAEGPAEAADVFRRIDQSCQRFLGVSLELATDLPGDLQAKQAACHGVPVLLLAPQSPLSRSIDHLADSLLAHDEALPEQEIRRVA
ncbi:Flagellum site-determining protein YlxH [Anatilimnocola aggregata]|uniref:Flagellum site-determining protein YlxH n=1 Tax=Anatilimnocola aggregata TaxID=2528021 RepID=A0A517YH94_9BACT|nr:P-loop NTPase [Anatilimnocola aggregata]QDU29605.1 Flagellum site-determining protein YlxH [Anatilimnocola aggregata]